MNDLLGTLSPRGNEWVPAEVLSTPVADDEGGPLVTFLEQFRRAQHELEGIDECLDSLAEAHHKSRAVHTANASRDLKESIERNIHLILLKSSSVQAMLDGLAHGADRSAPGQPAVQRIRTSLAKSMRKSLKDRMNLFNDLRANIEADYREVVERHYYIVSGRNPSAEAVDRIVEGGQSQDLLRQAIADQGRDPEREAIESIVDLEKQQEGMKDVQRDLQELHRLFMGMAALVLDHGDDMDDIENNIVDSASAVNGGVAQLGGATEDARRASKWIWGALIPLLVLVFVVTVVLVVVNLARRGSTSNFMPFGSPIYSII